MCLGLDLCSGKKRGRSYLLCFDETREFENDNQEEKKFEIYHLEGLLQVCRGKGEDIIREDFKNSVLGKILVSNWVEVAYELPRSTPYSMINSIIDEGDDDEAYKVVT